MLLFATFFILTFVLLILNSIPIFGSKRTKRFGKIPSLYFFILFAGFWVGRVVGFLYYEMNGQQERALDTSYDVKNVRGKIYTKGAVKKDFTSKNQIDSQQKSFFEDVNYLLKMAYLQALLVILFSYIGMKKYEKRIEYYKRKIIVHAVLFAFCIVLDAFVF
jgi:hypothetical protein